MKSIKRRFDTISKKNPLWSSYICFAESIRGEAFGDRTVAQWFQKIVDKDDYVKEEKRSTIAFLCTLTKAPEDVIKRVKNGPTSPKSTKDEQDTI